MNFYEKKSDIIHRSIRQCFFPFFRFFFLFSHWTGTIELHRISRDVRNYEVCNNKPRCSGIMGEGGGEGRGVIDCVAAANETNYS